MVLRRKSETELTLEEAVSHRRDLIAHAWRIVRNDKTAEDVVHEAYLRLMRQDPMPSPTRPWLFRVVRNLALNELRRQGRQHVWDEKLGAADTSQTAPDNGAEWSEVVAFLQVSLGTLDSSERRLLLHCAEGATVRQAAHAEKMSVTSAFRLIRSARDRLRSLFQERFGGSPLTASAGRWHVAAWLVGLETELDVRGRAWLADHPDPVMAVDRIQRMLDTLPVAAPVAVGLVKAGTGICLFGQSAPPKLAGAAVVAAALVASWTAVPTGTERESVQPSPVQAAHHIPLMQDEGEGRADRLSAGAATQGPSDQDLPASPTAKASESHATPRNRSSGRGSQMNSDATIPRARRHGGAAGFSRAAGSQVPPQPTPDTSPVPSPGIREVSNPETTATRDDATEGTRRTAGADMEREPRPSSARRPGRRESGVLRLVASQRQFFEGDRANPRAYWIASDGSTDNVTDRVKWSIVTPDGSIQASRGAEALTQAGAYRIQAQWGGQRARRTIHVHPFPSSAAGDHRTPLVMDGRRQAQLAWRQHGGKFVHANVHKPRRSRLVGGADLDGDGSRDSLLQQGNHVLRAALPGGRDFHAAGGVPKRTRVVGAGWYGDQSGAARMIAGRQRWELQTFGGDHLFDLERHVDVARSRCVAALRLPARDGWFLVVRRGAMVTTMRFRAVFDRHVYRLVETRTRAFSKRQGRVTAAGDYDGNGELDYVLRRGSRARMWLNGDQASNRIRTRKWRLGSSS